MAKMVAPDATWWVVGRPDYAPYAGLRPVSEVLPLLISVLGALDEFVFRVDGSIAEGNCVAIEASSSGRNGAIPYANFYLMRYFLNDGKIQSIREFMDGYEVAAYFAQLEQSTG
jgi:ketosteroid isomerase-like protein